MHILFTAFYKNANVRGVLCKVTVMHNTAILVVLADPCELKSFSQHCLFVTLHKRSYAVVNV